MLWPDYVPINRPPDRLMKAAAAIHVYPVNGAYSHMSRRVSNALLTLAAHTWKRLTVEQRAEVYERRITLKFRASAGEVKRVLDMAENDHGYDRIYKAIDALYRLEFRFDVMADLEGEPEWAVNSRLISQWAQAKDGSGLIEWEYPPDVFRMLMSPSRFAQIDLSLANSFKSSYALALYENTVRYLNNPGRLTPRLTLDEWRRLLVGEKELYNGEYRYFKRYVIVNAIKELQASPGCPIEVTLLETAGARNRVTHLQFRVELKKQLQVPADLGIGPNPRLVEAIRQLGVSPTVVNELIATMEEADLQRCLDETLARVRKGPPLRNPAGFFRSRCSDALQRTPLPEDPTPTATLVDPPTVDEDTQAARELLRTEFFSLTSEQQAEWLDEWKQHPSAPPFVRDRLERAGFSDTIVQNVFFGWLAGAQAARAGRPTLK